MLMAPPPAEATALVALMLLHDSRRDARVDEAGDLVVLEEQDRRRWNHQQIAEALPLVVEALRDEPGPFALQAAIAAEHCKAARAEDTDWPQIVRLYDLLQSLQTGRFAGGRLETELRVVDDGRQNVIELVGATGAGFTVDGEENEEGGGFVLLALGARNGAFEVRAFDQTRVEESTEPAFWRKLCGVMSPGAWIALTNPFSFDTERWLAEWNAAWPDVPFASFVGSATLDAMVVSTIDLERTEPDEL